MLAFDSISQTSMTKAMQIQTVYGLFHGDADDGIMGEAEKFIKGIGPYATMVLWEADTTNDGTIRHVILELLHRQRGKVLVRGDNITTTLIIVVVVVVTHRAITIIVDKFYYNTLGSLPLERGHTTPKLGVWNNMSKCSTNRPRKKVRLRSQTTQQAFSSSSE